MSRTLAAAVVAASALAAAEARLPSDPSPVSCSIDGLADWSRTLHFADLVKQSRRFGSPRTPWDGAATVDAAGWPTQDFGAILMDNDADDPPYIAQINGTYLLQASGNCSASVLLSSQCTLTQSYDAATNIWTATLVIPASPPVGQLMMAFENTTRGPGLGAGLVNVTVMQPGHTLAQRPDYSDALVAHLQRFDSLRFMDLLGTNDRPYETWDNRTLPTAPSFAAAGHIAWEGVCQLANAVGRDVWINVPVWADDAYIAHIAQTLYDTCDPSLTIYFEYSNEVWNWQFSQAHDNLAMANASVMQDGDPYDLNYDNCSNVYYWGYRRVAYMAKHIGDVFRTVYGNESVGHGAWVRPLLAGQVVQPFIVQLGLDYLNAVYGDVAGSIHGIAGAPYFNLGPYNNQPSMTVDGVLAALNDSISNMSLAVAGISEVNFLAGHARLANFYGLEVRAYEGGPDTSIGCVTAECLGAKANASTDPRMAGLMTRYLDVWASYGFGPLNIFVAGAGNPINQYGYYQLLWDMRVPVTPKTQGIDAYRLAPRPLPTVGIPVPTLGYNATFWVGHPQPVRDPYIRYVSNGSTFDFIVWAAAPDTTLNVTVYASNAGSPLPAPSPLGVYVTSSQYATVMVAPQPSDPSGFYPSSSATFYLPTPGLVTVRLLWLCTRCMEVSAIDFAVAAAA